MVKFVININLNINININIKLKIACRGINLLYWQIVGLTGSYKNELILPHYLTANEINRPRFLKVSKFITMCGEEY